MVGSTALSTDQHVTEQLPQLHFALRGYPSMALTDRNCRGKTPAVEHPAQECQALDESAAAGHPEGQQAAILSG